MTPDEREQALTRLWNACYAESNPDEFDSLADTLGFDEHYLRSVIGPLVLDALAPLLVEAERRGAEKGWLDGYQRACDDVDWGHPHNTRRLTLNPYRTPQPACHDGHHVPMCAKLVRNGECDGGAA